MRFYLPDDFDDDFETHIDDLTTILKDVVIQKRFQLVMEETVDTTRLLTAQSHSDTSRPQSGAGLQSLVSFSPLKDRQESNVAKYDGSFEASATVLRNSQRSAIKRDRQVILKESSKEKSLSRANETNLISSIENKFKQRDQEVRMLIRAEIERKRKLEEERKRIEEEERKRKEQEERKRKEEQVKRQKEEAKRKEEEEEAQKKKEAEEAAIKAKQEAGRKAEQEAKDKALKLEKDAKEAILKEERDKQERNKGKGITIFSEVESEYIKYKKDIIHIKTNIVEKIKSEPAMKSAAFSIKRKINPKFGQLTNSLTQLNRITREITAFITDIKAANDLAFNWVLNFIAKAIVSQSETEVPVSINAALPLAKLSANLVLAFPDLEFYLTARFVKKCPFIIGYTSGIDTEEGRVRMGWKRPNGKWEEEIRYNERMSGICTVFAVMTRLQITDPQHAQKKYPYPISLSWRFLARLLNTPLDQLTNAHFTCASSWWDSAARDFLKAYGVQGTKLLKTVSIDWTQAVADKRFTSAARLRILGEEWIQTNRVVSFKEMES